MGRQGSDPWVEGSEPQGEGSQIHRGGSDLWEEEPNPQGERSQTHRRTGMRSTGIPLAHAPPSPCTSFWHRDASSISPRAAGTEPNQSQAWKSFELFPWEMQHGSWLCQLPQPIKPPKSHGIPSWGRWQDPQGACSELCGLAFCATELAPI